MRVLEGKQKAPVSNYICDALPINYVVEDYSFIKEHKIRRLTPLECYRLMGFDDEDFYKSRNALNNTFYNGEDRSVRQLTKQAGNSIVVNVLEAIFKQLL